MRTSQHKAKKKATLAPVQKSSWEEREDIFLEVIDILLDAHRDRFRQVSLDANVHVSTLYKWVEGGTMCPRIDTLCRVARALGYRFTLQAVH